MRSFIILLFLGVVLSINSEEVIIFSPECVGEDPFSILLDESLFPPRTRIRGALFSRDGTACSRIWNGSGWVNSNGSWDSMPEVSEEIFLRFYPYTNHPLADIENLKVRFRTGEIETDWIVREIKGIDFMGNNRGVVGGIVEGYVGKEAPMAGERIEMHSKNELFLIIRSDDDGHFRTALPHGAYTMVCGGERESFAVLPFEVTRLNFEPRRVRINEVKFSGSDEWAELKNLEGNPTSVDNWTLTDRDYFEVKLNGVIDELKVIDLFEGRAKLIDTGDDVLLLDNFNRVVDFFGYGDSKFLDEPPDGYGISEISCGDDESASFTGEDFVAARPTRGFENDIRISYEFTYTDCFPFLSPEESFDVVMDLIDGAEERIYINTYIFSSLPVFERLAEKENVDIKILLGQKPPFDLSPLNHRISGTMVNHAKYAIIDDTFIVGSENWDENGLPLREGNRGWWVALEGDIDLLKLFALDWNNALGDLMHPEQPVKSLNTDVKHGLLLISPENSAEEIKKAIDGAEDFIYMEQLYVESFGMINALENASLRGVEITMVLDDRSSLEMGGVGIIYREKVHNKGFVIDNRLVLVSSINLSESSLSNNREVGVLLEDEDMVKFFYENRIV